MAFAFPWFFDVDVLDWTTGELARGEIHFSVDLTILYDQVVRGGEGSYAAVFFFMLMVLGVMFLTIEAVALVMVFALARSITGAVHELFTGDRACATG